MCEAKFAEKTEKAEYFNTEATENTEDCGRPRKRGAG
jgi:hypothetical protein